VPELYERARPGYPDEAISFLVSRLGLRPGRVVIDLAAGTGKLTRLLVPSGARVIAVEPLAEMRELLARLVPGIEILAGAAENLPLDDATADAVTVAAAFHWFDAGLALVELGRVLRPGGAAALVWNVRDLSDPLQAQLQELLRPYRGVAPTEREQSWRPALEASPVFGEVDEWSFAWEQPSTPDELAERVASISFVAQLPADERARLLGRVRAEAAGLDQPFPFRYRTEVHVLPRSSDQATSSQGTPPVSQPTRQ
jgi:SAM-dependent methyltransferase